MDIARVVALWEDRTLRTEEVAEQLGVTLRVLYAIAARNGLGRRKAARKKQVGMDDGTEITWRDPTPAEIEQAKRELIAKKVAKLRRETFEETAARVLAETGEVYTG